jgi:hypothetical protein
MSAEDLGTYLNDHLAGSHTAIELIERALKAYDGTPLGNFLSGLEAEIRADQETLQEVMKRFDISESRLKQAGAWLTEKASRIKLGGVDEQSPLGRLETLETLGLGILGKLALWQALGVAAPRHSELSGMDFGHLEQRAAEQHQRVEAHRLEAVREAL